MFFDVQVVFIMKDAALCCDRWQWMSRSAGGGLRLINPNPAPNQIIGGFPLLSRTAVKEISSIS